MLNHERPEQQKTMIKFERIWPDGRIWEVQSYGKLRTPH